jgi:hypothetical protein
MVEGISEGSVREISDFGLASGPLFFDEGLRGSVLNRRAKGLWFMPDEIAGRPKGERKCSSD